MILLVLYSGNSFFDLFTASLNYVWSSTE